MAIKTPEEWVQETRQLMYRVGLHYVGDGMERAGVPEELRDLVRTGVVNGTDCLAFIRGKEEYNRTDLMGIHHGQNR